MYRNSWSSFVSVLASILHAIIFSQEGHGGWNPKMEMVIGMTGIVHRVTEKNDVRVSFDEVLFF